MNPISNERQLSLTRPVLEQAMMDWTKQNEGPIGFEYIGEILAEGDVLEALDRVAVSMQIKRATFNDTNACLIWTAYMNMQEFGTPGFPVLGSESNGCQCSNVSQYRARQ